ncbi:MAG: hypothetical protein V3V74_07545 [Nitrosomonadaceae bacterium]
MYPERRRGLLNQDYLTLFPSDPNYSGEWKFWRRNGDLQAVYNFKDGKLHGIQKKYSKNGSLIYASNYDNDVPNGIQYIVQEKLSYGSIYEVMNVHTVRTGVGVTFDLAGKLENVEYCDPKDKRNLHILLYRSGRLGYSGVADTRLKHLKEIKTFIKNVKMFEIKVGEKLSLAPKNISP